MLQKMKDHKAQQKQFKDIKMMEQKEEQTSRRSPKAIMNTKRSGAKN